MDNKELENEFTKEIYSTRDLRLADPLFLVLWPAIKEEFGLETGLCIEISCTYRSPKAQKDLYQLGRAKPGNKVTNCDGVKTISKHNIFPSKAIDCWVHMAGKNLAIWEVDAFDVLGKIAKSHGLLWGGDFKGLKDRPHVEIPS